MLYDFDSLEGHCHGPSKSDNSTSIKSEVNNSLEAKFGCSRTLTNSWIMATEGACQYDLSKFQGPFKKSTERTTITDQTADFSPSKFFEEHQKPKIILGTIDTILQYFSTNWKHSLNRVATIQIDEFSMVPRSEFLQILSTFPNARYSFVGDYRQLAPFNDLPYVPVLSEAALGSPLEHMIHSESLPIIHFDTVFKCREEITQLLGTMFYFSTLQSIYCCDDYVQRTNQMLQQSPLFDQKQYPLIFIDTESEQSQSGTSAENESERNIAIALAEHLLKYVEPKDIGILCFYRGQSSTFEEWSKKTEIFVGSVDAAQGKTWPICIICTTRTLPSHKSPFIMNPRRINIWTIGQQLLISVIKRKP
ncbi:unnamed protein product [Caenorhabditis angaria]|uniref:DNA2/NAM7 helicase-like C-terminal domain-containing protein n=1 Tax=Caenorhabditis angaria TaxID=860376 RepID=A0A9P1IWG8_9PELO|nr:unnamed protein product [Caenorhabditis angaria]